jgi:hypothetical protein
LTAAAPYLQLKFSSIRETLIRLQSRVSERFPGSGLSNVCEQLLTVTDGAQDRITNIGKANWLLRILVGAFLSAGGLLLALLVWMLWKNTRASDDLFGVLQGVDSAFNILILMGASLFFFNGLEDRNKRKLALKALHELRSIVHIIDMHKLAKDPSAFAVSTPTPSSPDRPLSPEETLRYLDYCSEMLSLASKVAALYAQSYPDAVITETVSDIERTATGLSQKIWQKINITHRSLDRQGR